MKNFFIIFFLLVIFIGLIGYTGKVENESIEASGVVSQAFSSDVSVNNTKESIRMDQQQLLTLVLLFGAGLVGLLIIRRKWSLFNALLVTTYFKIIYKSPWRCCETSQNAHILRVCSLEFTWGNIHVMAYFYDIVYNNNSLSILCHVVYATIGYLQVF